MEIVVCPQFIGDTFYIDEVFVKINGKQHYLWRQSIRMEMSLMYTSRLGGMEQQQSAF
jgi:transposase-like protein